MDILLLLVCALWRAEYDEFQRQTGSSQASVDCGSFESGASSPAAARSRSLKLSPSLGRIAEAPEAVGAGNTAARPKSQVVSPSTRPRSPSVSKSSSRQGVSPERAPVVDPKANRSHKLRSSGEVLLGRQFVGPNGQPTAMAHEFTGSEAVRYARHSQGAIIDAINSPTLDSSLHPPYETSPRQFEESYSLSTSSSVFSQSKPGSQSPEFRTLRQSGRGPAPVPHHPSSAHGNSVPHHQHHLNASHADIINSPHSGGDILLGGFSPAEGFDPQAIHSNISSPQSLRSSPPSKTRHSLQPHHLSSHTHGRTPFTRPGEDEFEDRNQSQQYSSAAQRLIDSKLSGPTDMSQMESMKAVYEPSASESERDAGAANNSLLGGVSPVLSSLLAPADEYLIYPVSYGMNTPPALEQSLAMMSLGAKGQTNSVADPNSSGAAVMTSAYSANTSSSNMNATGGSGIPAATVVSANTSSTTVSGKRSRYSASQSRRSANLLSSVPSTRSGSLRMSGPESGHTLQGLQSAQHASGVGNGASGANSPQSAGSGLYGSEGGVQLSPESIPRHAKPNRVRSNTTSSVGAAELLLQQQLAHASLGGNISYSQGNNSALNDSRPQFAHIPQSDKPIPVISARTHHSRGDVSPLGNRKPPRDRERRSSLTSNEPLYRDGTYNHGNGASSFGNGPHSLGTGGANSLGNGGGAFDYSPASSLGSTHAMSEDVPTRGRTMSPQNSKRRSARSTSPMAYMPEGRLLQNTAARTPTPQLEDFFLIEDASLHYKLLEKLGKGSFGNVYIAKRRKDKSGKRLAIKKSLVDSKRRAQTICREIGNLRNSDHPNIVKFIGSYFHRDVAWIIMEYLDAGTLRDLRSATTLEEKYIAYIMKELLLGLEYMHDNGMMHRDLKGENILLSSTGQVKIADLGLAVPAQEDQKRIAGSKYWMAPEMILAAGYGPKADLYSLGCTAYELADGLPPYAQYSAIRALFCAAKHGFPPLEHPKKWSKEFLHFLATCTHPNPRDRPTCAGLLEHPFLDFACSQAEFAKLIARAFDVDSSFSGFVF